MDVPTKNQVANISNKSKTLRKEMLVCVETDLRKVVVGLDQVALIPPSTH